ncbi:phage holin family protein [Enemella sp. A6]|uniref:phage holin family protein n=1 Tax=Enemella sp. A6 TaxID=3440152 RepID=UPI003EBFAC20
MSHQPNEISEGRSVERQLEGDNRSIGEIFADLTTNLSTLMRQEVALAKAEVRESATAAGKGAGMFAGAGVAAHLMLVFLSIAIWWGIAHLIGSDEPRFGWAALIVAVIWAVVAAILALAGKSSLNKVEGAPRTAETVSQIPNALKGEEAQNR